jgi:L-lactate dehydrogenase (cytochrome)
MIGRAYVYGLGAGGEQGVARAIDIIRRELDVTMALTGTRAIREIGPHIVMQG